MQAVFWLQIQGDGQGTGLFPGAWGFMDNSRLSRIRLSVQIGLRYAGAFGANRFASFVSLFSAIGIMLGVAALIIVTSVMGGLENRLKNSVLSVVPHAVIESASGPVKEDPSRARSSRGLIRRPIPKRIYCTAISQGMSPAASRTGRTCPGASYSERRWRAPSGCTRATG